MSSEPAYFVFTEETFSDTTGKHRTQIVPHRYFKNPEKFLEHYQNVMFFGEPNKIPKTLQDGKYIPFTTGGEKRFIIFRQDSGQLRPLYLVAETVFFESKHWLFN